MTAAADGVVDRSRVAHTSRRRTWVYIMALVAVSVVSRLPQLLSPNLLVDGDEAVLGLMAKHLAAGRALPIFFYGQHYGFSLFEILAEAFSFLLLGTGAIPLKLAMLALWTLGVVFVFLALRAIVGVDESFWIAAVLVLTPMWAVWSMKARGGYITSFTATAALLWLLAHDRERQTPVQWIVAGALTSIIYLAQPLWLPGLLPIVAAILVSRRSVPCAAGYIAVIVATVLLMRTSGGPAISNPDVRGSLVPMAQQIYVNLTGAYYLGWAIDPPGPITKGVAVLWCGFLAATVPFQLYRLLTRRFCLWSHLLFLSLCFTLASELLLLHPRDARYLLPLSGLLVMLVGIELIDLRDRGLVPKNLALGLALIVLALGSASMLEFKSFSYLWINPQKRLSEGARLRRVMAYLHVEDVTHVFSMNGLLDTQLIFYSDEKVVARWAALNDRYPPYVSEVDRALAAGERVAVVGYTDSSGAPGCWDVPICTGGIEKLVANPETIFTVDGKYFVYVGADKELLRRLKFDFPD